MSGGNKARAVNDGDWICSDVDCSNINFSWRVKCNKCGKEKSKVEIFKKTGTEIGKKAAEKSGGLFSADDWHCSSCGNVNWARRTDCNVCNNPKFGTVEPRTGLGGGYNERENVEYIEREDSDDEYDNFGRKKKKSNTTPDEVKEVKTSVGETNITTTIRYDEEEEDSGEDFDLSKYDLADDEEEEDKDDNNNVDVSKYNLTENSPKSSSHRRSRSQSLSRSRGGRSRSRSPVKRRTSKRSRSRSLVRKRKSRGSQSRSRSRDRDVRNSRSRSKSHEKRFSRRSRSNSREQTRDRRTYRRSFSRSRSRSRDKRRGYRSRSRSRERYR